MLATKEPIPQFVVYSFFANSLIFQGLYDERFKFLRGGSVILSAVYGNATLGKGLCFQTLFFLLRGHIKRLYNLSNGETKLASEFVVSRIVRRHCHNSASSILHYNIVGYPDRNKTIVQWIYCICPGEHACFVFD